MKNLTEIIETLTQINRYEELKTILTDWNTDYFSVHGRPFMCFKGIVQPTYYTWADNKIDIEELKDEFKFYKVMTETNYPEKRKLNKIVKEYNLLVDKFDRIDVKYLTKKLIETLNLELELS